MKSLKIFVFLAALAASQSLNGQMPKFMKLISGGNFIAGAGYEYILDKGVMYYTGQDTTWARLNQKRIAIGEIPEPNVPQKRVTVYNFYLSESEVTNAQYFDFLFKSLLTPEEQKTMEAQIEECRKKPFKNYRGVLNDLVDKAIASGLMPDTACWMTDFAFGYNEPLVKNYFFHPAFAEYPVVGVSWIQANAYCEWLTKTTNDARMKKGQPELPAFRLPTEMEWEYAASFGIMGSKIKYDVVSHYAWGSNGSLDDKGNYLGNIKTGPGNYIGDGYEYTAPALAFYPNNLGIHNLGGNVAEWVADSFISPNYNRPEGQDLRVVKGGSWATFNYGALSGSRSFLAADKGNSMTGFRVAMSFHTSTPSAGLSIPATGN